MINGLKPWHRAGSNFLKLVGSRILVLIGLSIPIGLLIGGMEVLLGATLYRFLAEFGFTNEEIHPSIIDFPDWAGPTATLLTLGFMVMVFRFFSNILPSIIYETFNTRIRNALTDHGLCGYKENLGLDLSKVSHILSNVGPRTAGFLNAGSQVLSSIFLVGTILSVLLGFSFELTLISLIIAIFLGLPMLLLRTSFTRFSNALYENIRQFTHDIIKDIRNVTFLKISGTNEDERLRLLSISNEFLNNHVRFATLFGVNVSLPQFFSIAAVVVVVWSNAKYDFLPIVVLIPFLYLLSRFAGAVAQIASASAQLQHGYPFLNEMMSLTPTLFAPPKGELSIGGHYPEISLNSLTVNKLIVGREQPLTEAIDLEIGPGEFCLISGPSGQGKTTLLMTLLGITDSLDGQILWNNNPVDDIPPSILRIQVGYAGAEPYLFAGTIEDNLAFGNSREEIDERDFDEALKCARAEFVYSLDGKMKYHLDDDGEGISAGQKQRLAIARALLRRPRFLLLDEALANIDEQTESKIISGILEKFPDVAIIAVSHRSSMKRYATTELVL